MAFDPKAYIKRKGFDKTQARSESTGFDPKAYISRKGFKKDYIPKKTDIPLVEEEFRAEAISPGVRLPKRDDTDVFEMPTSLIKTELPEQEIIEKEATKKAYDDGINRAKEFEKTPLGRAFFGSGKFLFGIKKPSERLETEKKLQEIEDPLERSVAKRKQDISEVGAVAVNVASMLAGGGAGKAAIKGITKSGIGKALLKGITKKGGLSLFSKREKIKKTKMLANLAMDSLINSIAAGTAVGLEEKARGRDPKEASSRAAKTAGTVTLAIPGFSKLGRIGVREMGRLFSTLSDASIDRVLSKPKLMKGEHEGFFSAAQRTKEFIDNQYEQAQSVFDKAINDLKIAPDVTIQTTKLPSIVKKRNLDPKNLARKIEIANRSLGKESILEPVENMLRGEPISFHEARKINSVLSKMTRGKAGEISTGLIDDLGAIKTTTLDEMDIAVKGIKDINKQYAIRLNKLKSLNDIFNNLDKREAAARKLTEQLSGKNTNKTKLASNLIELAEGSNRADVIDDLLDGLATDEIGELGVRDFYKLLPRVGALAIPGGLAAGPVGAGLATGGTIAANSPQVIKAGAITGDFLRRKIEPNAGDIGKYTELLQRRLFPLNKDTEGETN